MSEIDVSSQIVVVGIHLDTRRWYALTKRMLDIVIASLTLLLLLPLMAVVAVAIRVDSPGPVLFRQTRIGGRARREDGVTTWTVRPFTIFKFRTMVADADPSLHQEYMAAYLKADADRLAAMRPERGDGESFRPAADPRITRVGAFLRRLSLDELPQLWNVVKGDMSLVGPRPPVPYEVEMYDTPHLRRLASPPGMTGWAQINGRCAIDFEEMVRYDVEYAERRSFFFDLKILFLTVPLVLSRKGAD